MHRTLGIRQSHITLLALALVALQPLGAASHPSSIPRNDAVTAGNLQCDTGTTPVTKSGFAGYILTVMYNQDHGHLRLYVNGSALGPIGCTFGIEITGYSCPVGVAPVCSVSNVVAAPCSATLAVCTATADLDFSFDFQTPSVTTHIYIDFNLVIWTGAQPLHTDPVVVASRQVHYWEPPVPVEAQVVVGA